MLEISPYRIRTGYAMMIAMRGGYFPEVEEIPGLRKLVIYCDYCGLQCKGGSWKTSILIDLCIMCFVSFQLKNVMRNNIGTQIKNSIEGNNRNGSRESNISIDSSAPGAAAGIAESLKNGLSVDYLKSIGMDLNSDNWNVNINYNWKSRTYNEDGTPGPEKIESKTFSTKINSPLKHMYMIDELILEEIFESVDNEASRRDLESNSESEQESEPESASESAPESEPEQESVPDSEQNQELEEQPTNESTSNESVSESEDDSSNSIKNTTIADGNLRGRGRGRGCGRGRGRGRPRKSALAPAPELEIKSENIETKEIQPTRGRGRGSGRGRARGRGKVITTSAPTQAITPEPINPASASEQPAVKRGRGRPRGSKKVE